MKRVILARLGPRAGPFFARDVLCRLADELTIPGAGAKDRRRRCV
jgi:hypothetical protein